MIIKLPEKIGGSRTTKESVVANFLFVIDFGSFE